MTGCQPSDIRKLMLKKQRPIYALLILVILLSACNLPKRNAGSTAGEQVANPLAPQEAAQPTGTLAPTATPTPLPEARITLAERALFLGDYDRAQREQQEALNTSSEPEVQAAALLGLGRTYYEKENYPLALDYLNRVINEYADSSLVPAAYFFLAQTYDATDQYSLAADAYGEMYERQPQPLGAYILEEQGDMLMSAGRMEEAISAYQTAIDQHNPDDVLALNIKIGRAYASLEDYGSAIRTYLQVYEATTDEYRRAQANFLAGQAYLNIGEAEQAYARFQDSVNNYPRSYDTYSGLVALVEAGQPVNEFQRGLVDYYAGQYGVSIDAFSRLILSDPQHAGAAHYYKGKAHQAIEETEQAIAEWQALIRDHTDDPFWITAWEEIAYTQWAYQENYTKAAQTMLDFVSLYPDSAQTPEMLFSAAQIMERDGRLTDAATTWERMLVDYPAADKTYRALFLAGISYYRLEDYPKAQTTFQRILLLSSAPGDQAAAYLWIGKAQAGQNDNQAAQQSWSQAATLDPTGYYSERAAELLQGHPPFTPGEFVEPQIDWSFEREKATAWLRVTFDVLPETNLDDPADLNANPFWQRALAYHELGLYSLARYEVEALREQVQSDPVMNFRMLKPLLDMGYYRTAILCSRQILDLAQLDDSGTLTAPAYFNYIRFGPYYPEDVLAAAERDNFDPYLLWSVLRQESMFEAYAVSSAGAYGLMQIMPATGEEIASRLNWPPNYEEADLMRPSINLRMGSDYLAVQREFFDSNMYEALAAYNGGPGNSMYWSELSNGDPDLFLEVIRFEETRRYIRQIYEFWNLYKRIYNPAVETGMTSP